LSRSRSFLLILLAVVGATGVIAASGRATANGHDVPPASFAPAFPASTVLGPRLFGDAGRAARTQPVAPAGADQPRAEPVASANWSGYVVTAAPNSPITDAQGSWTLPNVALSWAPTSSAAWVGIGGGGVTGDTTLAQVGTEQDSFYGFTTFSAWWSTASQGYLAMPITQDDKGDPFNVNPGDDMSAEVHQSSAGQVSFTLADNTTDQTTNTVTDYQGTGLTAEWILEAPSEVDQSGHFSVLTLADYGSTVFDGLTINGEAGSVDLSSSDQVLMEQNDAVISYPSAPSASGDAFAVAYGSTQPSAPTGATAIVAGPEVRSEKAFPVAAPAERLVLDGNFDSP
jgi:hypothetical protein